MTKERRIKTRVDFKVSVQVQTQSLLQKFYSQNLSIGGIFLELPEEPPPIGTKLRVSFEIPGVNRSVTADAEVVHHHKFQEIDEKFRKVGRFGMGLHFVKLSPADESVIQKYVTGKDLHVRD